MTVDEFLECNLQLFKVIPQDYREVFKPSAVSERDHCFFFNGQKLDFLHRIVQRSSLPGEKDWEALRDFDFSSVELLDVPSFMDDTEFQAKAMRVAKAKIDVEREKGTR